MRHSSSNWLCQPRFKKQLKKALIPLMAMALIQGASAMSPEEHRARALAQAQLNLHEFDEAIKLTPNIDNGRRLFRNCVTCHGPEGWGMPGSGYPQIAGQLASVLIKQMADFRAGNRDNPIMQAFASQRALGTPQDIADIAAYVASLPMSPHNERGFPIDLAEGERIYKRDCEECHGVEGAGKLEDHVPKLHGQHYSYMMRQFDWIRNGRRRNSDEKMVKQINGFRAHEQSAVMSYLSNIVPPNVAPPDWVNPDFAQFDRNWRPIPIR